MLNNIDFATGKIIYNEFSIDFDKRFEEQEDLLTEDLLQVEYSNNYLIDLGWYPECDSKGCFALNVVYNYNWDKPVYKKRMISKQELYEAILESVEMIKKLSNLTI